MMKKVLLVVAAVFATCGLYAQQQTKESQFKKLEIEDMTPELSVYPCQDRYEALVVIRCSEDFELEFKSNVDKVLNVTREQEGTEKIYSIVFLTRAEGTSFRGRRLAIIAPEFDKLYLSLDLKQKERKEYRVYDPYSALRSPYYTRNDKGNELFNLGMYEQALDQYRMAQKCPEYQKAGKEKLSIDKHISLCDSLMNWSQIVDSADVNEDYYTAREYLAKMVLKNPTNSALREKYINMQQAYAIRCNADMTNGELYMADGYYDKAKAVYENAVRMRNPRIVEAEAKLHEIEKLTFKKTNKTRVLLYQFEDETPINIFKAGCKPGETGGYFSIGCNRQCFDLLSNVNQKYDTPTLDYVARVSFGWTVPIFKSYAFAYFTPLSYVGGGYSVKGPETDAPLSFLNQDICWYHAVAPEAGIILKYWRIVVNYKYQYRYWIGQPQEIANKFGTSCHSFGVGFAW